MVYGGFRIGNPEGHMTINALGLLNPLLLAQFYKEGRGPLATNGLGVSGVLNTKRQKMERPGKTFQWKNLAHVSLDSETMRLV